MFSKIILLLIINLTSLNKINHINDLKWINRILVIMNKEKFYFSRNIDSLKKEFDERDLLIVNVIERNTYIHNKKMSKRFSRSVISKIKSIENNNYIFLIGKDGQVKNSYPIDIGLETIFDDVDKMPMRKYEMQIGEN